MKKASLVFLLILVVFLSGCNGQTNSNNNAAPSNNLPTTPSTTTTPASSGSQVEVEIQNFAFVPQDITINKGDTVTWRNMDSATHTVVSTSGSEINSGSLAANGGTYSHTFKTAGNYDYHCSIHPSMKGAIIVK